ncbi:rhomboid family intramembrane serine protease [Phaeovulum sp.]|uniref:rhomboid family intramembrane serine protease n=1 Tax=Phaeovulum sp. TaxID=2934796 RepID=UPI0039E25863
MSFTAPPASSNAAKVLWAVAALCLIIEAVLQAADHGLIGSARWRQLAWQYGAFWAGLLRDWRPNYAAQPVLMFLSYSVLHAGFWHLAGNMAALAGLGPMILARGVGARDVLVLWVLSAIGGGLAFGLLAASPQPMIGASGPLFGLAGAWKAFEWQAARRTGAAQWPITLWVLALALLNLVLWAANDGSLAWQTHLGGFVTGWAWALWFAARRGADRSC